MWRKVELVEGVGVSVRMQAVSVRVGERFGRRKEVQGIGAAIGESVHGSSSIEMSNCVPIPSLCHGTVATFAHPKGE